MKTLKLLNMKTSTFTSAKMSIIFKMAHRNAKSFEGHYQARMSMGLSIAHKHFNMLMVTDFSFLAIFNNINQFGKREVKVRTRANGTTTCHTIESFISEIAELTQMYGAGLVFRTSLKSNEFHFINTKFQASLKRQEVGLSSDTYKSNSIQAGKNAMTYRTTSI